MKKIFDYIKHFNRRSLKYGSLSIILIAGVVAIALVLNLIVGAIQEKGIVKTKFDLTVNKLYSIGDTTKEILKKVDKDVTIYGLFDMGDVNSSELLMQIKEVLSQYEKYKHITVKFLDPDKNPGLLKEIDTTGLKDIRKGDFVVKCMDTKKLRKLSSGDIIQAQYNRQTGEQNGQLFIGEQAFTGAVKYVTTEKTPLVYFVQGHQETNLDTDFKNLRAQLENNNYEVKTINLMTQPKIPEDAEILIVASPKADLAPSEKDVLKNYIKNGGKVVFLFDSEENNPKFPEFEDLLKNYNVGINYDKVKETDDTRFIASPYAVILDAPRNAVMPVDYNLLLVNSRSLNILKNDKQFIDVISLAQTSSKAIGEQIDKANGDNIKGPLDLALAVDYKGGTKPAKLLVVGNGYFVTDEAKDNYGPYYQYGNNFFTMTLNWMMEKKDEVVIEPKSYDTAAMNMSSEAQINTVAFILVIMFPLVILGFGLFIWLRRRHL